MNPRVCIQSNIVHDLIKYWQNTQRCSASCYIYVYIDVSILNNPLEIAVRTVIVHLSS